MDVWWEEWSLVVVVVLAYAAVLTSFLVWETTRGLIVGYSGIRPSGGQAPIYLPWAVFVWSACTAVMLAAARDVAGVDAQDPPPPTPSPWPPAFPAAFTPLPPPLQTPSPPPPPPFAPPPQIVKIPGSLGSSAHAFFSVGWTSGLAVFGINIHLWWQYALVCVYQMTRAVLGSMVNNIFMPFYGAVLNCESPVSPSTRTHALLGRALTSVFMLWSTLTDILMSASQFDLFVFTVAATVCADTAYGFMRIQVDSLSRNAEFRKDDPSSASLPVVQPIPSSAPSKPQQQPSSLVSLSRHQHNARRRSHSPAQAYAGIQISF